MSKLGHMKMGEQLKLYREVIYLQKASNITFTKARAVADYDYECTKIRGTLQMYC